MKQNLLIVGYDYDTSKRLANKLADAFSMRVLDSIELFEFDHIPFSFSEILEKNGRDYVLKKMKSILNMELDFDDAVFVANLSMAENALDLFYKIKLSNFVVLYKKNAKSEVEELSSKVFKSEAEKEFFVLNEIDLKLYEDAIEQNLADAVIETDFLSDDEIIEKIIDKIKEYYSVN